MSEERDIELSPEVERELAALADGTLAGEGRRQALARAEGSPRLRAELAAQRQAVQLLAAADPPAPQALHERIGAMAATPAAAPAPSPTASAWRRRMRSRHATPRLGIAFAAATLLAGMVGIVLALSGTGHRVSQQGAPALTASAAAALTLEPATLPAPGESTRNREQLAVAVGGVAFPYWRERFGWRDSGARTDTLDGRTVTTVFYSNADGKRIGYAIVAGRAPAPGSGSVVRRWGTPYRLSSRDGANVIVWHREGRLCVMSGRGVSARTLLDLASWGERPRAA